MGVPEVRVPEALECSNEKAAGGNGVGGAAKMEAASHHAILLFGPGLSTLLLHLTKDLKIVGNHLHHDGEQDSIWQ